MKNKLQKQKVLMVDDNWQSLEYFKEELEESGKLEVYTAKTRPKRAMMLRERSYDAYIFDVSIGGDSIDIPSFEKYDKEVFEAIRKDNPSAPIIMMTCHSNTDLLRPIIPYYDLILFSGSIRDAESLEEIILQEINKKRNTPNIPNPSIDQISDGASYDAKNFRKRTGD